MAQGPGLGHKVAKNCRRDRHLADVTAYIIHLERAKDRAAQAACLARSLPVPGEILAAVDARGQDAELGQRYDPGLGWQPRYPFDLTRTEIAVFLSHRRAWQRIRDDGRMAGLVVEDDIRPDPQRLPAAFALAMAHLEPGRVIRFPRSDRETAGETIAEADGMRLVRPRAVALGMQAQLVGREAAARLLDVTRRFDRPVDGVLQMTWETGIDTLTVLPAPVREIDAELGGSTQWKRRGLVARLHAELARALYRRRLAARAKRVGGRSTRSGVQG